VNFFKRTPAAQHDNQTALLRYKNTASMLMDGRNKVKKDSGFIWNGQTFEALEKKRTALREYKEIYPYLSALYERYHFGSDQPASKNRPVRSTSSANTRF